MSKPCIQVYMPLDVKDEITEIAKRANLPVSTYIKLMITDRIKASQGAK